MFSSFAPIPPPHRPARALGPLLPAALCHGILLTLSVRASAQSASGASLSPSMVTFLFRSTLSCPRHQRNCLHASLLADQAGSSSRKGRGRIDGPPRPHWQSSRYDSNLRRSAHPQTTCSATLKILLKSAVPGGGCRDVGGRESGWLVSVVYIDSGTGGHHHRRCSSFSAFAFLG